jgi:DNA polymerase V
VIEFPIPEKNKRPLFALVDCNQFYVSCERVFQPYLEGKAVGVLSNNDGCLVALSPELKKLGVTRGMPAFKIKPLLKQHEIYLFSSNYTLYGDMSSRVMRVLSSFTSDIEIYSIDEAFLSFRGMENIDLIEYAQTIRQTVLKWTGIPVSIGIAPSKTLAKIANRVAKTYKGYNGVFNITDHPKTEKILSSIALEDVWGIGRKYSKKMKKIGLANAADLLYLENEWVKKNFTVVGLRTVLELKGYPCIELEQVTNNKKQIVSSRSFGKLCSNYEDIEQAMSYFCTTATERLRSQKSVARQLLVYVCTNPFRNDPQYANFMSGVLSDYSAYTPDFISLGKSMLKRIFKPNYLYKKCGIMISDIILEKNIQPNLFTLPYNEQSKSSIMQCIDTINTKYGTNKVFFASNGTKNNWSMKRDILSPQFTTCWAELPIAKD